MICSTMRKKNFPNTLEHPIHTTETNVYNTKLNRVNKQTREKTDNAVDVRQVKNRPIQSWGMFLVGQTWWFYDPCSVGQKHLVNCSAAVLDVTCLSELSMGHHKAGTLFSSWRHLGNAWNSTDQYLLLISHRGKVSLFVEISGLNQLQGGECMVLVIDRGLVRWSQ